MERDYSIKLTDLKKKLKYLRSINDGSSLLEEDIIRMELLIRRLESNFQIPLITEINSSFDDIVDDVNSLNRSSELLLIIEDIISKADLSFLDYNPSYSSIYLSDRDAVDLAHSFYSTGGNIFYSNFLDVYDTLHNHLQFINPNEFTDGEMDNLRSTRDTYIFVPNHPNIKKATILIHEMQHAIDLLENDKLIYNTLIKEIASVFMELIASDYVAKQVGLPIEGFKRKAEVHRIVLSDSLYLSNKFEMFRSLNGGKKVTDIDSFYEELYKQGYDDEDIDENIKYSVYSVISYQLPQFLAIELFYIYKKDPQDAFELLKGLINYCNDDNILSVLNGTGIELGKHYNEYQKSLAKRLQIK